MLDNIERELATAIQEAKNLLEYLERIQEDVENNNDLRSAINELKACIYSLENS